MASNQSLRQDIGVMSYVAIVKLEITLWKKQRSACNTVKNHGGDFNNDILELVRLHRGSSDVVSFI